MIACMDIVLKHSEIATIVLDEKRALYAMPCGHRAEVLCIAHKQAS